MFRILTRQKLLLFEYVTVKEKNRRIREYLEKNKDKSTAQKKKEISRIYTEFILTNTDIVELLELKKDYLKSYNSETLDSENNEKINWHNFYPPLILITIDPKEILPLSSDFNDSILENISINDFSEGFRRNILKINLIENNQMG